MWAGSNMPRRAPRRQSVYSVSFPSLSARIASSAGAMIIARNTKAKTRSWTIGESPLGGLYRLGVIMLQVTKWGHPTGGLENYNEGGMDLA